MYGCIRYLGTEIDYVSLKNVVSDFYNSLETNIQSKTNSHNLQHNIYTGHAVILCVRINVSYYNLKLTLYNGSRE